MGFGLKIVGLRKTQKIVLAALSLGRGHHNLAIFFRKGITIWPVEVLVDVYILIIFLIFFRHKTLSRLFLVQLLVIHRSGEINSQFLSVLSFDSLVGWSCLI
jgi:hypothetical protein